TVSLAHLARKAYFSATLLGNEDALPVDRANLGAGGWPGAKDRLDKCHGLRSGPGSGEPSDLSPKQS
ncbi:MAG: hypothetical protein ACOC6F_02170, partial [bacterium]